MAEIEGSFNGLRSSLPFVEMDPNIELMSQFTAVNEIAMCFCNDSYLAQPHDFSTPFSESLSGLLLIECSQTAMDSQLPPATGEQCHGSKRRKVKEAPDIISGNSSTLPPDSDLTEGKPKGGKNRSRRGKWGRSNSNSKEGEKQKEVVHVRARRGQATDSHSLAERARREKINEKMRCLQDLVPGCYKAMGMAVMLDEIINYVQSLQNQIEFLSMKLTAASSFYDFNLETEDMAALQVPSTVSSEFDAPELERMLREGYGGCTSFHSNNALLTQNS